MRSFRRRASPNHFGPELTIGARLAAALPDAPVALIKHARGGTKLTVEALPYKTRAGTPARRFRHRRIRRRVRPLRHKR
jgi:hypothetical protein